MPWSFKREEYRQGSNPVTEEREPCTMQYYLLMWKEDVPGLKCRKFQRFVTLALRFKNAQTPAKTTKVNLLHICSCWFVVGALMKLMHVFFF